jgi:hypothetical protein
MKATSDYLNLTVPSDQREPMQTCVESYLEQCGGFERCADLWQVGAGGTAKFSSRGRVGIAGFSGVTLATMRAANLLDHFLHAVSEFNPRVSTLDMFVDVIAPGADVLPPLYRKACAGEVALTRKVAGHVRQLLSPGAGADKRDTGTVYIGDRHTHDVTARIYDKQHERLEKKFPDPGPLTRFELTVRGAVGATLRDVSDPTELFWHYAAPDLMKRPADVGEWKSIAFERVLGTPPPVEPYQRLKRLFESSADVERLLSIARAMPNGEAALALLWRKALGRGSGRPEAETPLPTTLA